MTQEEGTKDALGRKMLLRKLEPEPSQALLTAQDSCSVFWTDPYYSMEATEEKQQLY